MARRRPPTPPPPLNRRKVGSDKAALLVFMTLIGRCRLLKAGLVGLRAGRSQLTDKQKCHVPPLGGALGHEGVRRATPLPAHGLSAGRLDAGPVHNCRKASPWTSHGNSII